MSGFEYPVAGGYTGGCSVPQTSAQCVFSRDELKKFSDARKRSAQTLPSAGQSNKPAVRTIKEPMNIRRNHGGSEGDKNSPRQVANNKERIIKSTNKTDIEKAAASAGGSSAAGAEPMGLHRGRADAVRGAGLLLKRIENKAKSVEIINKTVLIAEDLIAVDSKEHRAEGVRKKIPLPVMLVIVTLAMALMLVVAGNVIASKASMELSCMKQELERLDIRRDDLITRLELKNDLVYIESVARGRLGMIDRELARVIYIGGDSQRRVIILDEGEGAGIGISTLLDALGFIK